MGVLEHLMEIPAYLLLGSLIWYGGLYGFFGFLIAFELYKRAMWHFYKMENLSGMDAFWMNTDGPKNIPNIIAFMRFEKFDANQMKDHIFAKSLMFTRNRSKVVK